MSRTKIKPLDILDAGPSEAGLVLATDGDGNFVLVPQEGGGGGGGPGIMGWDEGVPLQTGTILNVVGGNVDFSISGTVLRLFVTGTVGGGGLSTGSIDVYDGGVFKVKAHSVAFQDNLSVGVTGGFAYVDGQGGGGGGPGIMGWDEGVPLGTGTILDIVGENADFSISGTVLRLFVTGSIGGNGGGTPVSVQTGTIYAEEVLYEVTLLSATGSIVAVGLSQDYDHLRLLLKGRSTRAGIEDTSLIYFNNDTTVTNYKTAGKYEGTIEADFVVDTPYFGVVTAANSLIGEFASSKAFINDYSDPTKRKDVLLEHGERQDATNIFIRQNHINWENTDAINRIDLGLNTGPSFASGTHFQILGIKEKVVVTSVEGDMAAGTVVVYDEDAELGSFGQIRFKGDGVEALNSGSYAAISIPGGGGGTSAPSHCLVHQLEGIVATGSNNIAYNVSQIMDYYSFWNPGADGQEIIFNVPLQAGIYTHNVIGFKAGTRAKIDWYFDGTTGIAGQDWYDGGTVFNTEFNNTGIIVSGSQTHEIKVKINGRNASSTGWAVSWTFFTMVRTGD